MAVESGTPRWSVLSGSRKRLFVIAAIWHITFAGVIFLVGRSQVLPQTFDTNGIGVSFAIDSRSYRIEAENLARLLHQRRLRDWVNYNASFHVKVYSLSCAILGNLVGFNILAVEPVNLVCYLSILCLVYAIARETFDRNVARLATIFIGLWPSLVLHTTQMLRDAVFIPSMLLLVFALLLCVTRPLSVKQGSLVAGAASFGTLLLWLCRGDMWEMVFLIVLIGAGICVLAQLKERRFGAGKTVAIMSILIIAFWIPSVISSYRQSNEALALTAQTNRDGVVTGDSGSEKGNLFKTAPNSQAPWSKLAKRVGLLRHKFIMWYPLAGSNIDTDVELAGVADVVRYLPRATLIGLFSPFPKMWFTKGAQVGLIGRLVAGGEMVIMYSMFGLMVYALILQWNRLSFWLLLGIALIGCTALGYVVVNVSSLYRMRYVFFILLIILGTKGLLLLWPTRTGLTVPLSQENARVS
jgi:hypothetical protein